MKDRVIYSLIALVGIALMVAGVWIWLGMAAGLISAGLWLFILGAMADIGQGKKPQEPKK